MFQISAIDRCVDEISSTLELAEALENQLEKVREAVSREECRNIPAVAGLTQTET